MGNTRLNTADYNQLTSLLVEIKQHTANFLGYPVSKDFDFEELLPFLNYPMNNLSDPFATSTYAVDSRAMEREVVAFFANLLYANSN